MIGTSYYYCISGNEKISLLPKNVDATSVVELEPFRAWYLEKKKSKTGTDELEHFSE